MSTCQRNTCVILWGGLWPNSCFTRDLCGAGTPSKIGDMNERSVCSLQGLSWWHKDMGKRIKKPQTHDKEGEEELEKKMKTQKNDITKFLFPFFLLIVKLQNYMSLNARVYFCTKRHAMIYPINRLSCLTSNGLLVSFYYGWSSLPVGQDFLCLSPLTKSSL